MTYGKRGLLVRLSYLFVAMVFFVVSRMRCPPKRGTIVLCYHGIKDSQKFKFLQQLRLIKNRVVASIGMTVMGGRAQDNLLICVTFDDAFANLLANVIPFTTERQIPVTIFIPTGSLGALPSWLQGLDHSDSSEMVLSVDQISALKENPMVSFGSHTADHPRLSLLKGKKIREQLRNSRDIISKIVDEKITELALPYGDYNEAVIRIAREEGYQKIYTLEPKVNPAEESRLGFFPLGRFSVSPEDWPVEFFLTVNGAYTWLEQWRSFLCKLKS